MPLYHSTPFDREPAPAPPGEPRRALALPWRRPLADFCFILIKAGGFLGSIYLAVLGLPLLFFLALAGGNLQLLFLQVGNLSTHYLAADGASQAAFAGTLKLALMGVATFVAIWRLPRFLNEVGRALDVPEKSS
jgi:hypothetical protein